MAAWNYLELRHKQTELYVAEQILEAYSTAKSADLYIKSSSLDSIVNDLHITQNLLYQHTGLERLEKMGLIKLLNLSTLRGIHISIIDIASLKRYYIELYNSIPATGNSARIVYSKRTGRGLINGMHFKLNRGSRNRKVFEYLLANPNKYIQKKVIWKVAGEKSTFIDDPDGIIEFNTIITTLRESLKNISPEHLRLKQTVILDASITLTD